jgi:predicted PurR-regulated permease PerM
MTNDFNNRLRQVFFLLFLIAGAVLLFDELYVFFPGFLGALTLYILSRRWYFLLTTKKTWNKSLTAVLFMVVFLICVAAPVYFCFQMFYQKVETFLKNPAQITQGLKSVSSQIRNWTGQDLLTIDITKNIQGQLGSFIPKLLNSSATLMGNLLMILFLLFFMLVNGPELEKSIQHFVPLRRKNVDLLAREITMMVKANALGIPLVSLLQGTVAMIGYWLFGIKDFVILGFVTGLFAFFPIVGTAAIWLPVTISLFAAGENGKAIGLGLFNLIITGNIDYLARITLLKRIGNVHPVVTILGLVVGLKLFGFLGFIFGPLLISSFMLLVGIYKSEFGHEATGEPVVGKKEKGETEKADGL